MRLHRPFHEHAGRAGIGRSLDRDCRGRGWPRASVPPVMQAVSRILSRCPGSVLAAAQLDLVVGDLDGNVDRMLDAYDRADAAGCDLVAFPELSLTGYPPEDLLLRPSFVAQAREVAGEVRGAHRPHGRDGRRLPRGADATSLNAAAVCANGRVQGVYRKHLLPNYAVFDEQRYFTPSPVDGPLFVVAGVRVAVTICEDAWSPTGPILTQAAGGAELDREPQRLAVLRGPSARARDDARARAPPTPRCPSCTRTSSAARTSWSSTARRWCSTKAATSSRARGSSRRTCSSSTSTCARRSVAACSTPVVGRARRGSTRSW